IRLCSWPSPARLLLEEHASCSEPELVRASSGRLPTQRQKLASTPAYAVQVALFYSNRMRNDDPLQNFTETSCLAHKTALIAGITGQDGAHLPLICFNRATRSMASATLVVLHTARVDDL